MKNRILDALLWLGMALSTVAISAVLALPWALLFLS